VSSLVGWLVGWSVSVFVHRLVSGLVGRLVLLVGVLVDGGLIGCSVGLGLPGAWAVGQSTG